jgi:urease accessory protein
MDERALLGALQLADGTLPIGRFSHSYGLEAWLEANPEAGAEELRELVDAALAGSVATLDAAAVALAHTAAELGDVEELGRIDAALTARKLSEPARRASTLCGGRLASLALELDAGHVAAEVHERIESGAWAGNLAVVEGVVCAGLGVGREAAVLISLRGHAAALLSAAVRLGRLGTVRAQALLRDLTPELERCAHTAQSVGLDQLRSTLPELDIHAARHRDRDARLFIT